MPRVYIIRPVTERFLDHIDYNGPIVRPDLGPCHLWIGALDRHGYGEISLGPTSRPRVGAHRVAFLAHYGRWPEPNALHRCDNPPCVRWEHLYEGTHADNSEDMVRKGRSVAKVTSEQVKEIRKRYASGKVTQVQLAEEFGLRQTQISNIVRYVQWRWNGN